jgi:single-strand DNA-binding protein
MSGSLNKATLIGNLGRDPEQRQTGNGGSVVNLSIATSESWKDKASGERKEKTEWHRIVIFNENLGKIAMDYLRKGSKVYLEGQIQTRKWTDKDGNEKYSTEIVVGRFDGKLVLLGGKNGATGNQGDAQDLGAAEPRSEKPKYQSRGELDDEIPF